MALCPGGTRAKETTPGIIILLGALAESLLFKISPQLAAVTSLLAPITVDSRILCNGDPPPLPDLVALDFIQLATGVVTQNVKDLILRAAWFQFCECVDAPTPPMQQAPTLVDAPVVIPGPVVPCSEFHLQFHPVGNTLEPEDLYGSALAPIGLVSGATSLTVKTSMANMVTTPYDCGQYAFFVRVLSATGTVLDIFTTPVGYTGGNVYPETRTFNLPAGAVSFYVRAACTAAGAGCCFAGDVAAADFAFYCGGAAGRTQPDCCPPDPALAARLDFLAEQVQLILDRVGPLGPLTEIASQPITGEGVVSLDITTRQVNIQITTFGEGTSLVPYAHPDRLMRAGTIRFGNDFGWRRREHIDNTDCLFVVPVDSTRVSWSLSPGTEALLVQLGEAATP